MSDISLQINLSPGDIAYARLTVPALVNAHRKVVKEIVAIVDCCRPPRTKIVNPDIRFPKPVFNKRVEQICEITEGLRSQAYIDRIYYLRENDPLIKELSAKYLRKLIMRTHDYGGCALMAYLAAFEVVDTKYLLHYDSDMLIHQSEDFDWTIEARELIEEQEKAVAATPRISPPFSKQRGLPDAPSLHEGRPLQTIKGGWRNDWFSTRCFLIDRWKVFNYLPLLKGRMLFETLAVKYLNRGYPRSPEIMMFRRIGGAGGWRLNLQTEKAWLLHPQNKPPLYLELLPEIQSAVKVGQVPEGQRGYSEVNLPEWERFLSHCRYENSLNCRS